MNNSSSNPDQKLALTVKNIQRNIIDGDGGYEVGISGLNRQQIHIGIVVNILLEDFELNLSHSTAESRVRNTLQKMMKENLSNEYDDPVRRFRKDWPEITEPPSPSEYTIMIPLPIAGQKKILPTEVEFNGQTLNRVSSDKWREFEQRAEVTEAEDTDGYPPALDTFIQGTDMRKVTSSEYSFWRFEQQGADTDYIVQQIDSILSVFLGQLSFVADNNLPIVVDQSLDQVRAGARTVFQLPPFYLIFRDSAFHRVHPNTYPVSQPIPRIRSDFYFMDSMSVFPSLATFEDVSDSIYEEDTSVHIRPIEATLGTAFRTFGRAMRETDPESMFLSLYRTLEHITFTKYAESKEPLVRALRLLNVADDQQIQQFINVVKERRNTIVHDGTDLQITQTELNLLKALSISTISRVGKISQSNETDEIITQLLTDDVEKAIQDTQKRKEELSAETSKLQNKLQFLKGIQDWDV